MFLDHSLKKARVRRNKGAKADHRIQEDSLAKVLA
jgi:hypothetical protein